jgi:hypothetical protein
MKNSCRCFPNHSWEGHLGMAFPTVIGESNPPFPVILNPLTTLNFHPGNMIFPHLQEEKMIVSSLSCINLIPA